MLPSVSPQNMLYFARVRKVRDFAYLCNWEIDFRTHNGDDDIPSE